MTKVIAIFGAGPGLSSSVARYFGRMGYELALVGRNSDSLNSLTQSFRDAGFTAKGFLADLATDTEGPDAVHAIEAELGPIDTLYYAPIGGAAFAPAATLTAETAKRSIDLYYYGLIRVIEAALPAMRKRGQGQILTAWGGSAKAAFAGLSGVGPAMAAQRNYIHSLQQELAPEGINVGAVSIMGVIKNSAAHQASQKTQSKDDGFAAMPEIDPDELTRALIDTAKDPKAFETDLPR